MKMPKKAAVESFRLALIAHADRHADIAAQHDAIASAEGATEETATEARKTAKFHRTHAKANTTMVLAGNDALAWYIALSGDTADKCDTRSRELKERAAVVCAALAAGRPIDCDKKHGDRAADAAVQYVLAGTGAEYTLPQVQAQMRHETTTQAGYFASFLATLGAGAKVKGGFTVDRESAFWRRVAVCYGATDAGSVPDSE